MEALRSCALELVENRKSGRLQVESGRKKKVPGGPSLGDGRAGAPPWIAARTAGAFESSSKERLKSPPAIVGRSGLARNQVVNSLRS